MECSAEARFCRKIPERSEDDFSANRNGPTLRKRKEHGISCPKEMGIPACFNRPVIPLGVGEWKGFLVLTIEYKKRIPCFWYLFKNECYIKILSCLFG